MAADQPSRTLEVHFPDDPAICVKQGVYYEDYINMIQLQSIPKKKRAQVQPEKVTAYTFSTHRRGGSKSSPSAMVVADRLEAVLNAYFQSGEMISDLEMPISIVAVMPDGCGAARSMSRATLTASAVSHETVNHSRATDATQWAAVGETSPPITEGLKEIVASLHEADRTMAGAVCSVSQKIHPIAQVQQLKSGCRILEMHCTAFLALAEKVISELRLYT